jgi:ferric-dicitrate binding protein FerR (iron transport regulator)
MQISPGTEMVLPSPPGRWFGRAGKASVDRGQLRVTTGRRFGGARLAIRTPEATVHVTGTTLAVIAESTGTRVCVLEGVTHVRPHRGAMTRVHPGSTCVVDRGTATSRMREMREAERPKLLDLRDRLQAVMN